jgi:hypothetical protein
MENSESAPKLSFAQAVRAALEQKHAAEHPDTVTKTKTPGKTGTRGPAVIHSRPQRRNTGRGG